jgi:hypothetical protein
MLSLLQPGYGREPETFKNNTQHPTPTEQDVANKLQITNCKEKSAYISVLDEIEPELYFLSRFYSEIKFNTGKDDDLINKYLEGFLFDNVAHTKIPMNYRWIMDTGIYSRLREEKVARKNKLRSSVAKKNNKKKVRLDGVSSLEGGLVTLFILCGCLMSFAVLSFVFLECRDFSMKLLRECYFLFGGCLKAARRSFKRLRTKIHNKPLPLTRIEVFVKSK